MEISSNSKYKIFKLANGQCIIATLQGESSNYIDVLKPFGITEQISSSGHVSLSMHKWDFISNYGSIFRIFKSGLVSISIPSEGVTQTYIEMCKEKEIERDQVKDYFDEDEELELVVKGDNIIH